MSDKRPLDMDVEDVVSRIVDDWMHGTRGLVDDIELQRLRKLALIAWTSVKAVVSEQENGPE